MNFDQGPNGSQGLPNPSLIPAPPSQGAQDLAHAFASIAITLNVVSFVGFSGRIYTRSFPVFRLGWDDYIATAAFVFVIVDSTLLLLTVPFVFYRDPASITLQDTINSNRYAVIAEPIWAWAMATIKVSIAAMLLRLQQERYWQRFLWAMIIIQVVLGVYNNLTQLLQCIPLHAAWDILGVVKAKCWSDKAVRINLTCISSINIATDVIFSLLPITFLRKVQRPLRERIIIGILMGLGIFASVASIIKAVYATDFGNTDDPNKEGIAVGMWSCIEEQVGFIACCIPCLKSPFQKFLTYFGLITTQNKSAYGRSYGQMYGDGNTGGSRMKGSNSRMKSDGLNAAIKMKSMRSTDTQSEENILAVSDEQAKDGEIWCTTEVHLEEERRRQDSRSLRECKATLSWTDESKHSHDETWAERMHSKDRNIV
ncbi:hypothetical protein K469DRAFT_573323 [Zopfia rhizophila CBS 207.26]|uniref:Rhodopsin domain-containing protein n=1 Tax=Zopfia rhizophila CBS 207.26 TaxID=1314779 RepID=A0A6A6E6K6_9PEZI|nr:hypothetical protein K469DRAFT_573323 [Zopfia rhizophila CBS 207.26]